MLAQGIRARIALLVLAIVAVSGTAWYVWRSPGPSSDALLDEARLKLAKGQHQQAEQLALRAARGGNAPPAALLVAAEAVLKTNRYADALDYYRRVPRSSPQLMSSADFGEAEMLCHLGRLSESESRLRQLLQREPANGFAHYRLAFVLNITGRRWEAQSHLLHLVRNGLANEEHFLLLGNPQRLIEDQALLKETARIVPEDPLPSLGAACLALTLNRRDEARRLLETIQAKLPDEPESVVRRGGLLVDDDDPDKFIQWSLSVPASAEQHPDIWMIRGRFAAQRDGQMTPAARCFWEAYRRNPEHLAACHQLGRSLTELGDAENAAPFLARAELLQQLANILDDLFHHQDHVESMRRASILAGKLGRIWETVGWADIALTHDPSQDWARQTLAELVPRLRPDMPQSLPEADASRRIDLSHLPLPNWNTRKEDQKRSSPTGVPRRRGVSFVNSANAAGIDFRYDNCADDTTPGARIFETTGGGVGAIDYDRDGWTDLYFTQAGTPPHAGSVRQRNPSGELIDRLYRNRSDGTFVDCTLAAGLGDPDFGQGVAVGDIDNDGFADLYVANFGQNRLYVNHGDGTFADVTDTAGISDPSWTTSCMIADVNADGLPDLYDVNYVAGDSVLSRICEKQGVARSCSPRAFDTAPDRLWLNEGNGQFRDVTTQFGIDVPGGPGLGIVAADFDGSHRLSLFVANDETPNFLFVRTDASSNTVPRFQERALLSGVAVDADGMAQACMGVAVGDADGDGLLDLYVTNFYLESNTLYRQIAPGQFTDATRAARLRDPSFPMLGFGSQFLDVDLDGWEDLAVTNGHIDDLGSIGEPYKMPAQIYLNQGYGVFDEVPAEDLGSFFQEGHLGRGLARLDWNRDGRDDFVISHICEPAALMTNTSSSRGHHLAVSLRGTAWNRDAIGATVQVTVGNRRHVKQLTAGDGYMASNERQLIFGLGQQESIDELQVRWPGGTIQSWKNVKADQALLIIEGASRFWQLARSQ